MKIPSATHPAPLERDEQVALGVPEMAETITSQEAAALLKKRLGFSVQEKSIYYHVTSVFPHLSVRQCQNGRMLFRGVNKAAWLNFLSARNAAKSAQELFSTGG